MAELLLITPQEVAEGSVVSGNVDVDKYAFCIANVQLNVIEPLLGTELLEKLKTDFEANNLTGLYLELYQKFVKNILKEQTIAQYIEICSYSVDNGGIYTHQAENEVVPERAEIELFANKYRANADVFIQRFYKWIVYNDIPEYKTYQEEVNAQKNSQLSNAFYFGNAQDVDKWGQHRTCLDPNFLNRNCNECY